MVDESLPAHRRTTLFPPDYPRPDPRDSAPDHPPLRQEPRPPRGSPPGRTVDLRRVVRAGLLGAMVVTVCAALVAFGQALTSPTNAAGFPAPVQDQRAEAAHGCPVTPPYKFTDTIGEARSGGRRHQGTDMFGDAGSPIKAVTGGEVTKAVAIDDGTLGGARVWIKGDDGWWWYYAHLSKVFVSVGERVEAESVIGLMGNTGNARTTPPHLHIEQHLGQMDGPFVDPFVLVNLLCPQQ